MVIEIIPAEEIQTVLREYFDSDGPTLIGGPDLDEYSSEDCYSISYRFIGISDLSDREFDGLAEMFERQYGADLTLFDEGAEHDVLGDRVTSLLLIRLEP